MEEDIPMNQSFIILLDEDVDLAIREAKAILNILRTLKKVKPSERHQTLVAAAAMHGIRI